MNDFRAFMIQQGYSKRSVETHIKSIGYFTKWLDGQAIELDRITSNDLLDYLMFLQSKEVAGITINSYLLSVKHYLKFKGIEVDSFDQLRVRNKRKKVMVVEVINYDKLEKLCDQFPVDTPHQKRYKVIFGLIVYQALRTHELSRLTVDDIDINCGKISIKSTKNSNGRTLDLNGKQIMPLHTYLSEIRGSFERVEDNDRLFLTKQKGLHMVMHQLQINLRKRSGIESLKHIRASVINHWLNHHNLRRVQYWCGHKYVSSTEAYLDPMLLELEDELGSYHPLG